VIARCERRIGQELRNTPRHPPGPAPRDRSDNTTDPPTLAELGISKDESAAYQEMASVEEQVILEAIAAAGAPGRQSHAVAAAP